MALAAFPDETARALEAYLKRRIRGEIRFDGGSRALYATDASNYRQVPIGVVIPRSIEDVVETVAACRRHGAPVLARGGGTSLAGQCCNVAVVVDCSKYLRGIVSLDPTRRVARVQPGCVLDHLRDAAERHHLTFGPDPSTHTHNTLGGMIGNNSCGVHSVMAGRTADNVERLDILTYDGQRLEVGATSDDELDAIIAAGGRRGEIYRRLRALRDTYADDIRARFPRIPRRVSGFALEELLPENGFNVARALVGSEGTCVMVLEAELRLVPSPPGRALAVIGYPDIYQAADHVIPVKETGVIGLEGMDDRLIKNFQQKGLHLENLRLLPPGGGWLLAEYGGADAAEAEAAAREALRHLGIGDDRVRVYADPALEHQLWQVREAGLGATAHVPGEKLTWEGWEDSAVAPDKLGDYLRQFRALLDRFGYGGVLYGHFGGGCVHTRIDFDLFTADGIARFKDFTAAAANLVVAHGGSLSGEHGDGQSRADLLERMYGPRLIEAFREFKSIWDPTGNMNPGKVVDPYPRDSNLRLGIGYHPRRLDTAFAYASDRGDFNRAVLRCVGVGECRRAGGAGVMCPSFMATHEEKHSTRGRARLLFEMTRGEAITDGWQSKAVWEALDLCLSCKGCKHDCPVNVDMAAYKAEFAHHHFQHRLRPRSAYAMGLIPLWARAAALAPALANWVLTAPGLGHAAKWVADIAPQRNLPPFAAQTFTAGFRARGRAPSAGRQVVLFPDTFTEHFHTDVAWAATRVLERAGWEVRLPARRLCCGRPLFAWGWLDMARRWHADILDTLEPFIRAGTPVVVLEPACASALKDELPELHPDDERAKRLAQLTVTLADLLAGSDWRAPRLERPALVQPHCHQRSVLGLDGMGKVMAAMGLEVEMPETGCCGMAGSFGFEAAHYDVAMACGERVLLPRVRAFAPEGVVIADGFSCREQIIQATGRPALHLAQVIDQGG